MIFCLNNFKNEKIHWICVLLFCYNLKFYGNLPGMHARNDTQHSFNSPSFSAVSLHMYIVGWYFVSLCRFDGGLPWHGARVIARILFVLNDSVIRGSLNNHSFTIVKFNIKKIVTCFVIGGKPVKGKTKGILSGKLTFPPSTWVIVILQRLEAFTHKNCSFQLWYLFMMYKSIALTKIERNTGST